jgi:hypothetical protein
VEAIDMKIIFTVCSNNYLAQARTLISSLVKFAPEYRIFVALVDEMDEHIDYDVLRPATVLPVTELGLPGFRENCARYDIIELNTSVKPSVFKYLIDANEEVEKIFYFDPDTKLYSKPDALESFLDTNEILLTPHILRPIPLDGLIPGESTFLNYGIYNLGFLGIRSGSSNVREFLNWWEQRCVQSCVVRLQDGLFVDQLWINLIPHLFGNVRALDEYGYNMAPWNVHERIISFASDGSIGLNDGSRLTFYHFSGYRYDQPNKLSIDPYNRVRLSDRDDLMEIYSAYRQELLENGVEEFSRHDCRLLDPNHELWQAHAMGGGQT